jgi:predicted dehydrogenase
MAERLRCGVIGAGAFGLHHLRSLAHCAQASAVAIAESDPKRAKEATELYKIPRSYSDYRELLDQPDIDAVIITLPNHLHAPVTHEALQARKHVLLEKPMALNAKEAAKIIDTSKKMKRTLMVGQNFRFKRATQIAKEAIDHNQLGDVYHVRCFWLRRSGIPRIGSWFTQKQYAGGGCVSDLGVHLIDTALYLLKDFEVATVSGQVFGKLGPKGVGSFDWGKGEIDPRKPFDVDDYGTAFIRLRSGKTISLEVSWAGHQDVGNREYGLDLLGTSAGVSLYPARLFRDGTNGYETVELSLPNLPFPEDHTHYFVNCVLHGKKPIVTLEESFRVQQVLDAIYASANSRKEIAFK